jgi:hypothetical protein
MAMDYGIRGSPCSAGTHTQNSVMGESEPKCWSVDNNNGGKELGESA